ncbi:MAG: cytochrome P450 [Nocardia sp.]|nr:cytochrome P450 [Nocardia sp.]
MYRLDSQAVPVAEFPFDRVTANEASFTERDERYRLLHEWPQRSYPHRSGLRMIWKYDDVREVLAAGRPEISRDNSLEPLVGYPRIAATPRALPHLFRHLVPLPAKATADLTDGPLHDRVWNTMAGQSGHFTIRAADRPRHIAALTEHFHAALATTAPSGADLDVTALSIAYATRVTGSAVGLSPGEWSRVAVWSGAQSGLLGRSMRGRELAGAVAALGQLFTVSGRAVDHGLRSDAAGFATRLRDAGIPRRVAVSAVANSLAAGVHTVSGSIQQGAVRLLADPSREWWRLLAEPRTATEVAVKVLQLDPGLVAWKRRIRRPLTLTSGAELPAGPVLVMFAAANRDPAAFPDCLDLRRGGKLPLTFGFGAHICPGKQLATLAVEVFLRQLYLLAPGARPVEVGPPPRRGADLLFSGADLHIALDGRL